VTQTADLELYYPVTEDVVGKHQTPYSEYVFVEYREEVSLHELERTEIFRGVIRDNKNEPQLVPDEEIERIRAQVEVFERLETGERVKINQGSLKGNYGEVTGNEAEQVHLKVSMGDETVDAVLPSKWVRRVGKRKKL